MSKKKESQMTSAGLVANCLECAYHQVIPDPEPDDWFCADDMAVVCTKSTNPERNVASKWKSHHSPFRSVVNSCRPHHLHAEAVRPGWCPLLN